MSSSVTTTAWCTNGDAAAHGTAPIRLAPSESAARPDTETSTGVPAAIASRMAGISSGSTLTTLTASRYHDAVPAISPPPPTATSTVVASGSCSDNSRAIVPWPATTSAWSYGCTSRAPLSATRASAAAWASS